MKKIIACLFILPYFFFPATSLSAQSTPVICNCELDTLGLAAYLVTLNLSENNPLAFEVQNSTAKFAVLHGTIGSTTPSSVQTFMNTYPNVTTLVFMSMPGSQDDDANLMAARALRNKGYITYLPAVQAYDTDAFIASGAVDLFLSGTKRIIDTGGEVGVHAWADENGNSATNYPPGHAEHQPYINYYVEMGFSQTVAEAFYHFTINAAPANAFHNMSEAEIEQYGLRTCKLANDCTDNICMENIILTTSDLPTGETGTVHRKARNSIEAAIAIQANANVTYTAGQEILLKPGFQTENNTQFHAYIATCTLPSFKTESISPTLKWGQPELINSINLKIIPNPVAHSTNFHFFLSQESEVKLLVHDFKGQHLFSSQQTVLSKGWHTSLFDATKFSGGMYYVTLLTPTTTLTKKMVLRE